ncbi:hypothetical protein QAD02_022651 [Eretmocerus hayati]|uniref:Uncharacterized protein n=1 Tax=Eretmocerus hayati TaxID=131215 RepID=A0ACC2PTU6_9HYME|nr:hypothetical protein QAD02_022651 [Eretmocerus hayati]
MTPNLEVVVGTYEQFLLGYTIDDVVNKYKMEQSFATHSHLASIRSVASNKHYLASAAADDTVCLYDMRNRTENGKLVHHTDTVNSVCFTPDGSHIITASSDGTIGIVRCGNWQVEKHWLKPHKGLSVEMIAVHPSGKIAMTTGHDGVLRTWNLVKGRQAYATNLIPRWKTDAKYINILKWSPDGQNYLIAINTRVDIYSVETAGVQAELSFSSKVVCAEYLNNEFLAVGLTDGKICIYDLKQESKVEFQAHSARVKCMAANEELLISASSAGEIKLWSFNDKKLKLLNQVNCNCRISCVTLTSCLKSNVEKDKDEASETLLTGDLMGDAQEPSPPKKSKFENPVSKKRKLEDSDQLSEVTKKKMLVTQKKRKEIPETVLANPLIKKKKMKKSKVEAGLTATSQVSLKKKKRKITPEESTSSLPKKQKMIKNLGGKISLKKKKKQKNFKNKISR